MNLFSKHLKKHRDIIDIIHLDSVDSTNTYAKSLAENGAKEGTVVVADYQTNGRGRMGREFYSPKDSGLYMSIILRPKIKPENVLLITTLAAVAVANAIEEMTGNKTHIKWVNDVYMNSRKVCGILTEGSLSSDTMSYAILGIGINISSPSEGFPNEIKGIAGSICEKASPTAKALLLCKITEFFFDFYGIIENKDFLSEYRKRCMLTGKNINIIKNNTVVNCGICQGIDDDFSLIVTNDKGTFHLSSGEVSVRCD